MDWIGLDWKGIGDCHRQGLAEYLDKGEAMKDILHEELILIEI